VDHIQFIPPEIMNAEPEAYAEGEDCKGWDFQELPVVQMMSGIEFEDESVIDFVLCPHSQVGCEKQRLEKEQRNSGPELSKF
jgi:hypothetical protein